MDLTNITAYKKLGEFVPQFLHKDPELAEYMRQLRNSLMNYSDDKLFNNIPLPSKFSMRQSWDAAWGIFLLVMNEVMETKMNKAHLLSAFKKMELLTDAYNEDTKDSDDPSDEMVKILASRYKELF
ncbi:hypothetical protein LCGC14_0195390 [marine sediment metagenome]|uniref:Uncharacterized protein n=1 Tax=marine sediment metagenome TaxID=412755 RepID=A0A0F9X4D3_9ZZZZ